MHCLASNKNQQTSKGFYNTNQITNLRCTVRDPHSINKFSYKRLSAPRSSNHTAQKEQNN